MEVVSPREFVFGDEVIPGKGAPAAFEIFEAEDGVGVVGVAELVECIIGAPFGLHECFELMGSGTTAADPIAEGKAPVVFPILEMWGTLVVVEVRRGTVEGIPHDGEFVVGREEVGVFAGDDGPGLVVAGTGFNVARLGVLRSLHGLFD